jgi:hypothetical protein
VVYWTGKRNIDRVWEGKPEGNRSLGKPEHRVEHSVKTNSKEIGWEDEGWINMA